MEKMIISGTISVQKWTGMAFIRPTNCCGAIALGPKLSQEVTAGERAVAVVHEREDGKLWTDAIFNVNVNRPLEGAVERAEAWAARHRW